jgi:hypothetical protein
MLIFWDRDMLLISCATRWEIGAVEVTQGHELFPAAPLVPVVLAVWAAAAGTAISPAKATPATAVTRRRSRYRPQLNRTRLAPALITVTSAAHAAKYHAIQTILAPAR